MSLKTPPPAESIDLGGAAPSILEEQEEDLALVTLRHIARQEVLIS